MKQRKGRGCALLMGLVLLLGLLGGCGRPEYTVTFDLNGGELVSGELVQTVREGRRAVAPEAVNGKKILSWDREFDKVMGDMTVTAQWQKVEMTPEELAEYVQPRTVTIDVETFNDGSSAGTGFFVNDHGTVVTNFHVVEMAGSITVTTGDQQSYPVTEIVAFEPVYDLAVLRIDLPDTLFLEFSEDKARAGQEVYAVGSALGTLTGSFTGGRISAADRMVGPIECVQMDAAISEGNSGGPLVDIYGEVVGINAFSYTEGENLNLAIKPKMLRELKENPMTVAEFEEWYEIESGRSYSPVDPTNYEDYYYSLVNTYQIVTHSPCLYSVDANEARSEGYYDMSAYYVYEYVKPEYDAYVDYLTEMGFVYDSSEEFTDGVSEYYYNEKDALLADLFVTKNQKEVWVCLMIG